MTNLEELQALCREQDNRGVYTSSLNGRQSITITESGMFGSIHDNMGGTGSIEEYAALFIKKMKPAMKVVT